MYRCSANVWTTKQGLYVAEYDIEVVCGYCSYDCYFTHRHRNNLEEIRSITREIASEQPPPNLLVVLKAARWWRMSDSGVMLRVDHGRILLMLMFYVLSAYNSLLAVFFAAFGVTAADLPPFFGDVAGSQPPRQGF